MRIRERRTNRVSAWKPETSQIISRHTISGQCQWLVSHRGVLHRGEVILNGLTAPLDKTAPVDPDARPPRPPGL